MLFGANRTTIHHGHRRQNHLLIDKKKLSQDVGYFYSRSSGVTITVSSPMSASFSLAEVDRAFLGRLEREIQTVQSWDADPTLLQECHWMIPWDELRGSTYSRPNEDAHLSGNAVFLQRLCRFFKETMTWVNAPECDDCGSKQCVFETIRGPETLEEREGGASRVEGTLTKIPTGLAISHNKSHSRVLCRPFVLDAVLRHSIQMSPMWCD
jgi:hypothetical protein